MKTFLRLFHVSLITLILAGAGVTEAISEALAEHVPRNSSSAPVEFLAYRRCLWNVRSSRSPVPLRTERT